MASSGSVAHSVNVTVVPWTEDLTVKFALPLVSAAISPLAETVQPI